ncbi:hypothetical protein KJS94_11180 [Flavihumibacter rivuli]|uniref:hypothetical protein n=1 Tax=Flavihumibacter rivuli TaxID=2838156 RepID=UPI001BDEDC29|nr:hypothetical protein [Flavihumibacter rivuli]ULQ55204.1 hypothetical protein KJS94_11180 [Flavihumibacter rivuli]
MIIYGTRSTELAKEVLTDKCQNCGTQNCIDMHVFQKYAHIFWIPFFPMGKIGLSQCDHCKQVLKVKEMPASLKASYDNLKAQTKAPIWMFSGLAVVAVLIMTSVVSDKKKDERNAKLILSPQVGDIFEVKTRNNNYTLYRVDQVKGDSVFIQASTYEVNRLKGLKDVRLKEYSSDVYGFSKIELKEMFSKGEILDINRN